MFSPSTVAPAASASRNPRRRQRTGSDDSVAVRQQPKRLKRSGLTSETYVPPSAKSANGTARNDERARIANGQISVSGGQGHTAGDGASLAIRNRGGKRSDKEKRGGRGDGAVELTRNNTYTVTRLATTPIQLQEHQSAERWHGILAPATGFALAATHSQALVWRYKHGISTTDSTKPLVIRLLHPSANTSHPLPLGFFVPSSAEPGLLIIMPVSGKITYWETLSSAASTDPVRQKQQAIQGTFGGLVSGEHITEITEAEPQGYLLTLSSGRIAHLSIADPQGKTTVDVQILRSNNDFNGGLFGTIKNVFSSSAWRREIAAVKAGSSSQRGQRQCIVATTKGVFQVWDLNWNGAHSLLHEVDARAKLYKSLLDSGASSHQSEGEQFEVLDFSFRPHETPMKALSKTHSTSAASILVLTAISGSETTRYSLIALRLIEGTIEIDVVHPISCYTSPTGFDATPRPKLLIPNPGQTAFVSFQKTLVLVSLEEIQDSPDSQLQIEAHTNTLQDPFQDAIDFRRDKSFQVVGYAAENLEKGHHDSSCIFMIQGYGVIKVAVSPMEQGSTPTVRATVTAKTKLEQAIFYGSHSNLLDFSGRPEVHFETEDVERAALEISHSITSSTSKYLSTAAPSMEQQLQRRMTALADLNKCLRQHYQPIRRECRWQLLWEAEKMAAARAVWAIYDRAVTNTPKGEKILFNEIVNCIHEDVKIESRPENYESDPARHWLINDTWRLEWMIPWASKTLQLLYNESVEDQQAMNQACHVRLTNEANDLQLSALETAYKFRQENAALYGLGDEKIIDGVLERNYEGLTEMWTASHDMSQWVKELTNYSYNLAVKITTPDLAETDEDEDDFAPDELVEKLAIANPRLIKMYIQTCLEQHRFLKAKKDSVLRKQAREFEAQSLKTREKLLLNLSQIGQSNAAIKIAETYRDMTALAAVIENEILISQEELTDVQGNDSYEAELVAKIELLRRRIDEYFKTYGAAWANAFFSRFIDNGRLWELLDEWTFQRPHLTSFLQSDPRYARLAWINEVGQEEDYSTAAYQLKVASKQEETVWSKKIQLSMSKLATMAAVSQGQTSDAEAKASMNKIDRTVEELTAQERLQDLFAPTLSQALNDPIARTEIIMEHYGRSFVRKKPALRHTMQLSVTDIIAGKVLGVEEFIDTVSLIDDNSLEPGSDFMVGRFLQALKLLRNANVGVGDISRKDLQEKIIWRRCIIQDDWADINHTENLTEKEVKIKTATTALFRTLREGFKTGEISLLLLCS